MHGTGEDFHGAELHRLQGEFLLAEWSASVETACTQAEACFSTRFLADRLPGDSRQNRWSFWAAMSLTRLYQTQDRHLEARPMLAECYDWFTEGLDTPDLQEARTLLEQVS